VPRERARDPNQPSATGEGYPWDLHSLAVQHIQRLELAEARQALAAMIPHIRSLSPASARAASHLAHELIGQARCLLGEASTDGADRLARWKEAAAFSTAQDGPAVAAVFQAAVFRTLQPYRGARSNPLVGRARAFIEQNYSRKLSLHHVADFLNVSRNYLSSLFRKECRCTITEYIHQNRVRRAEALLLGGTCTVSEVAYQVGYQNYRDFYRNFVRHAKSSPTDFRRTRAERRLQGPAAQA